MPVLDQDGDKYCMNCIWEDKLLNSFNVLMVKKVFRENDYSLITGGENGIVKVYKSINKETAIVGFQKEGVRYETKADSIHTLLTENVTKFSSNDILVGDAKGMLITITNGQILNRRSLCDSSITGLTLDTDAAGNTSIVVASACGTLVASTLYDILWRLRLAEALKKDDQIVDDSLSIVCIQTFRIQSGSMDVTYLVVADAAKHIHIFQNGRLVMSLNVPSVVTSMCTGNFINQAKPVETVAATTSPAKSARYSSDDQVAMATKSGTIFILTNFTIVPYTTFSFPITNIKRLLASGVEDVDAILCCGHFNKLCILQNGETVGTFQTEDWIHSLDVVTTDSNNADSTLLCIGCVDNSVKLLQLRKNR